MMKFIILFQQYGEGIPFLAAHLTTPRSVADFETFGSFFTRFNNFKN